MRLAGRVAMITGANRGLGREIALRLAADGAVAAVCARDIAAAESVVAEISATGGRGFAVQLDVTNTSSCEAAVDHVLKECNRIDMLINNAGITKDSLLLRMSEDAWDAVIDTNLKGVYRCSRAVLRPMLKARNGCIVSISSVVGISGNPGQTNYSAAKAGIIGFTKSLAQEVAGRGIRVNAVAPGYVDTDMTQKLSAEQQTALLSRIPLGKTGKPADIAAAVAFLVSDDAAYITGQTLVVDGGLTM